MYEDLNKKLIALIGNENDFIANASNFTSFIYNELGDLNWVGFYFYDNKELVLGMFQGKPACIRIHLGKGVCGTAAEKRKTIVVDDVHKFPGHIACDEASNSEIVIPIIIDNKLIGVLDIDSPKINRFKFTEQIGLENLLKILIQNSDFTKIINYYGL